MKRYVFAFVCAVAILMVVQPFTAEVGNLAAFFDSVVAMCVGALAWGLFPHLWKPKGPTELPRS